MTLNDIWEWLETEYDGSRSGFSIQLYENLRGFVGDLRSDEPGAVPKACRYIWCGRSLAYICSIETGRPIVTGAFEAPAEAASHSVYRGRRTRTVTSDAMNSYVFDHQYIELPHSTDEWTVIKDALDGRS